MVNDEVKVVFQGASRLGGGGRGRIRSVKGMRPDGQAGLLGTVGRSCPAQGFLLKGAPFTSQTWGYMFERIYDRVLANLEPSVLFYWI